MSLFGRLALTFSAFSSELICEETFVRMDSYELGAFDPKLDYVAIFFVVLEVTGIAQASSMAQACPLVRA